MHTPTDSDDRMLASRVLAQVYGVLGTVDRLHGELDRNYAVVAGSDSYILKIMRANCDPALVQLQCEALAHLAESRPALPLPRVMPTKNGMAFGDVRGEGGEQRLVWLLQKLPGTCLSSRRPVPLSLLQAAGTALGELVTGLSGFSHSASDRYLRWNLLEADWIGRHLTAFSDPARHRTIADIHERFNRRLRPALADLRRAVIHGDANTDNLLVEGTHQTSLRLSGIIDFGDMCQSALVCEVAVACAYAMMNTQRPVAAAEAMVAGFHASCPLQDRELALIFPLVLTRLAVSATVSALEKRKRPDDPYVTVSEAPAWQLLEAFRKPDFSLLEARLRLACGLEAVPRLQGWRRWLAADAVSPARVLGNAIDVTCAPVINCSVESTAGGDDPLNMNLAHLDRHVEAALADSGTDCVVGRYGEARALYTSDGFCEPAEPMANRRTRHLGVDLFAAAGTPVCAPLDGTVVACGNAREPLDYGGYVILRHDSGDAAGCFDTVYGHLDPSSIASLRPADGLAAGTPFAVLGGPAVNGGWPPHLHFQVALETQSWPGTSTPPGVSRPEDFAAASALFPNPAPLLGLDETRVAWRAPDTARQAAERRRRFARNLKLSYAEPMRPVRGRRHHLFDAEGRVYLDAYNNVPHVGHCHPVVVDAACRQMQRLNTNTRYLHDAVLEYAERLAALMPDPLNVCFFLNSASEANELALRLARAHTSALDTLVMQHGYHGNTTGALSISPYKFNHMGGPPDWVHVTPQPDLYRGEYRDDDPDAAEKYAASVAQVLSALSVTGRRPAAYICEAVPSVGGQIVLPPAFLQSVYRQVRAAGGVCICDDVQTGLGRLGDAMWGFELNQVVPDIVVLGKPLGNGHPLAAVVTTAAVAESFGQQVEFFSTFGGNTVSCAVGIAVLDVLVNEKLVDNARDTGATLNAGLHELASRHELIGDVRGHGLFLGVELVTDRHAREPAARQAEYVKNRLRKMRVLVGTEGPDDNVLKIRPPMTFDATAADFLLERLDEVLGETDAQAN